jgi:hypothetical protein
MAVLLTASMSRSLELTGSNWGLRKNHKDRHREKLGSGGPNTPDERCRQPPSPPSACIYTASVGKQGEMLVEFSWVQLHRQQEQCSCGMLLFSIHYPDQVSMSCFSCKAALPNFACPWQGLSLSAKKPLTELCSCQGLSPLPQSPLLQGSLAEPC